MKRAFVWKALQIATEANWAKNWKRGCLCYHFLYRKKKRYYSRWLLFRPSICIGRFGNHTRCRNNALAPGQAPSNLRQQCECCSENTLKSKTLKLLLDDVESIPADIRQALINNGVDTGTTLFSGNWWLQKKTPFSRTCSSYRCNIWFIWREFQAAFTAAATRFGSGMVGGHQRRETWSDFNSKTKTHQSRRKNQSWAWDVGEHAYYVNTASSALITSKLLLSH